MKAAQITQYNKNVCKEIWYRAVGKRLPCSAVMKCNSISHPNTSISHPNTSISHHKVREKPLFADIIDDDLCSLKRLERFDLK